MESHFNRWATLSILLLVVGTGAFVLSTSYLNNSALAVGGVVGGGASTPGGDNLPDSTGWQDSVCSQITNSVTETEVYAFAPPMTADQACANALQNNMNALIERAKNNCVNDLPTTLNCTDDCRKVWNVTDVIGTYCYPSPSSVRISATVLCHDQCKKWVKRTTPTPRPL